MCDGADITTASGRLAVVRIGAGVLFASLLVAAMSAPARAQDAGPPFGQYLHRVWTTEEGLPQNSVRDIVQTPDGYLWVGTLGGLARFDGVQFTVFDEHSTDGILNNWILGLHLARDSTLWIAMADQVARYRDGVFTAFVFEGETYSLLEDRDGTLWIGGDGLARFEDERITRVAPDLFVRSLYEDRTGTLWIGATDGLYRFDRATATAQPVEGFPHHTTSPVRRITEDRDGILWIAAANGLIRFDGNRFTRFVDRLALSEHGIGTVFTDRKGAIWFNRPEGLTRYADGAFTTFTPEDGLSDTSVRAVFEDREGVLWIGTERGGLNRLAPRKVTAYTSADGLSPGTITLILEDADGSMLIGGQCGALTRFREGRFYPETVLAEREPLCYLTLLVDRTGALWIGHGELARYADGQLTVFDAGDRIDPVFNEADDPDDLYYALHEDQNGILWIGREKGLIRFDGDQFEWVDFMPMVPGNYNVRCITEDRAGALWLCGEGGLIRLEDGVVTDTYGVEDGLAHSYPRDVYEDADGTLWIATYGGGLSRFKDGRFTTYSLEDGLHNLYLSRILEDDYGHLWFNSNRGLFHVSHQELNDFAEGRAARINSFAYGVEDGMVTSEGNGGSQPAGWKASDGRLWFPTINGVVVVDPKEIFANAQPPPVRIVRVVVDGEALDLRQAAEAAPGRGEVAIQYTALSLVASEKAHFKVWLEGYDEAPWSDVGPRRVAHFTNLSPGAYTFHVQAASSDGVWSEVEAAYTFTLAPHFYETGWFYALCVLLLGFVLYGGYRGRTRSIQARSRKLQRLVDDRTAELSESEAKYRRLVENLQDEYIFFTHDRQGTLTYLSPSVENVLGYPLDEALNESFWDYFTDNPINANTAVQLQQMLSGTLLPPHDREVRHKNGSARTFEILNVPMYDEQGAIIGVEGIAHDITERKKAEEQIRQLNQTLEQRVLERTTQLEAKHKRLVEAEKIAQVGSFEWDIHTNQVTWSDELYRIYGRNPETFGATAEAFLACLHPDDRAMMQATLEKTLGERGAFELEERIIRPDGAVRVLATQGHVVVDAQGAPIKLIGVCKDVTERKQVEAEREAFVEQLEAQNAELERYAYTVSHELKTPLVTINNFLGLLEHDALAGNTERLQGDINHIKTVVATMGRHLRDLLDLSRIGRRVNLPEAISLTELARAAADLVAGPIATRGVAVEIAPTMPVVQGDRMRLLEVYQNLIHNAVKFMGEEAAPHIEIGARHNGEEVLCWVQDNGVGIAPAYHAKVFGLFERLDTATEGTGIGLALVKRIVEVHGGWIWVESEGAGHGSAFYFTLPTQDTGTS